MPICYHFRHYESLLITTYDCWIFRQESRAVAREPRGAAAVVFGLKFADTCSQASKARLQSSKLSGAKQNLTQNGHSRSRDLESVERR